MANIKLIPRAGIIRTTVHGYTKNWPKRTDCGQLVSDNRMDWMTTGAPITCEHPGCKN